MGKRQRGPERKHSTLKTMRVRHMGLDVNINLKTYHAKFSIIEFQRLCSERRKTVTAF